MLPIPAAKKSDHEDVAWALSTAEAQWGRGEKAEALKWLRRAADAASEAEDDVRALELAKAAADLSGALSVPPPPHSKPPPLPPSKPAPPKPLTKPPVTAKPAAITKAPSPQQKKAPRKSVPPKEETKKAERSPDDTTPRPPQMEMGVMEMGTQEKVGEPRSQMPTQPPVGPGNDADAWPTESVADLPVFGTERTRIGQAYEPPAAESTRVLSPQALAEARVATPPPALQSSQAVRVIVWRDSTGVHVAPAGTTITSITVDAMLVAIDPAADLSAWLSQK